MGHGWFDVGRSTASESCMGKFKMLCHVVLDGFFPLNTMRYCLFI